MTTTNWQAELDRLHDMLSRGVLRSRTADGKELVFDDAQGLERRIAYLEGKAANPGNKPKSRTSYATFRRD